MSAGGFALMMFAYGLMIGWMCAFAVVDWMEMRADPHRGTKGPETGGEGAGV